MENSLEPGLQFLEAHKGDGEVLCGVRVVPLALLPYDGVQSPGGLGQVLLQLRF